MKTESIKRRLPSTDADTTRAIDFLKTKGIEARKGEPDNGCPVLEFENETDAGTAKTLLEIFERLTLTALWPEVPSHYVLCLAE